MFSQNSMSILSRKKSFSFEDFSAACQNENHPLGEASMRKKMQNLLKSGVIVRVGRNAYCLASSKVSRYQYEYSDQACQIAETVVENYPFLRFSVFELIQLNEFVNHQQAHNVFFLSVEEDVENFVFDMMKERYPGKVLIDPTPRLYHQYWYNGMIVINKLVTEAPKGVPVPWHTRLEKMLVDLVCDEILMETISESEYPTILEDAFTKYAIDESCLFRYAKRRGAEKRFRNLIRNKTDIELKTE